MIGIRVMCVLAFSWLAMPAWGQSGTDAKAQNQVVIGIPGGTLGKELRDRINAFTKPAGIEAVYVEGTANDLLAKARAQKNSPQMDLLYGNDRTFALAKSLGLLEKIDPKVVTNLAKVRPQFRDPDGYGQYFDFNTVGLCYRTDKFAEAKLAKPSSFLIYADPALKGRGVLFNPTVTYGHLLLTGVALGAGKDENDISPAWPKLEQFLANKAVVVSTPGQADTMIAQGDAWIGVCPAVRAKLAKDQGLPVGFALMKEGVIGFPDFLGPVRGAKNVAAAQRIINYMISPEVQEKRAAEAAQAPVIADVTLTPDIKELLGFDRDKPLPTLYVSNVDVVNRQLDAWVERFNRAVSASK